MESETLMILNDFHQIHRIYLLNGNNEIDHYSNLSRKIQVNLSSDISSLCSQIEDDIKMFEREILAFHVHRKQSTVNQHVTNSLDKNSNQLSNQQEAVFMYSTITKEILCMMEDDDIHNEMIGFCRSQYANNQHTLKLIDELDRDFSLYSPITWYTRETFLYKMLNRALRINDVKTLFYLHNYVRHLHQQILSLQQQSNQRERFILYRGQRMPTEEFESIKSNVGGLMSVANFFSTTAIRELAAIFAGHSLDDTTISCVLFEIDVDPTIDTYPFANIEKYSYFNEGEREYLFSMGTVFRIQKVYERDNHLWIVHLTLTDDNDAELTELRENLKLSILDENPTLMLGGLLIKMGEYEDAEFFYRIGLTMENKPERLGTIWNQLGSICSHFNDIDESKKCFKNALEIKRSYLAEDDLALATIYNNIGTIYKKEGNDTLALEYFERALAIHLKNPETSKGEISAQYNNIAAIYIDQGKLEEAFLYQQHALEVNLKYLPTNHPDISNSYYTLAMSLYGLGRYPEMLDYMQKTLAIDEQTLPPNHPQKLFHEENLRAIGHRIFERILNGSIILEDD